MRSRLLQIVPGSIPTTAHSTDQIPLYDGLTPLFGDRRAAARC
jgi:hypothetical protein